MNMLFKKKKERKKEKTSHAYGSFCKKWPILLLLYMVHVLNICLLVSLEPPAPSAQATD